MSAARTADPSTPIQDRVGLQPLEPPARTGEPGRAALEALAPR
ncbi:MAG: hypothetical protein ACLGIZ_03265 [Acidimicrobiia bacterium]